MTQQPPSVIVLAGPNGAGKSTIAPVLLPRTLGIVDFVNADDIARGLSAYDSDSAAIEASEIMLRRLRTLAEARVNLAFETTLASRSLAPWLKELIAGGYEFHLFFLWLPSADAAVARVAERVRVGGHHVPEETIRRRYDRGLRNFFELYQVLATNWRMDDSSEADGPKLIARGQGPRTTRVLDQVLWKAILGAYGRET